MDDFITDELVNDLAGRRTVPTWVYCVAIAVVGCAAGAWFLFGPQDALQITETPRALAIRGAVGAVLMIAGAVSLVFAVVSVWVDVKRRHPRD